MYTYIMASFKFIACQAGSNTHYKNLRTKVMKCCANIYFNGQCLKKGNSSQIYQH